MYLLTSLQDMSFLRQVHRQFYFWNTNFFSGIDMPLILRDILFALYIFWRKVKNIFEHIIYVLIRYNTVNNNLLTGNQKYSWDNSMSKSLQLATRLNDSFPIK